MRQRLLLLTVGLAALLAASGAPSTSERAEAASAVAVEAGDAHSCVITDIGALKCWGNNQFGQLGDGTTITRSQPREITGLSGVAQAAPAAPTNLRVEGENLAWTDNSDNEDGFRIMRSVGGGTPEAAASLPSNTTSAPIPAPPVQDCEPVAYFIVAFNASGLSAPSETLAIQATDCEFPEAEASPTAVVSAPPDNLPATGTGARAGGQAWAFVALAGCLILAGIAALAVARSAAR